ncbi:uncharacterized protein BX663DRAFT_547271 [Cokeromyces recurvatus]|uniref:uncharacterized protein n=1 Tax=Cokeromyces recurvatus TaxID=90255 RepID=UPI00221E3B5D|nr:uncharacterized protein BX663DRAFT_547271 [Cokeromyces recurvatus]KAI7907558.1 hypothetical protein BX663DRAFT_547271 [Cokeromyces recurvatus]
MSNPIADTAEYFAQWGHHSQSNTHQDDVNIVRDHLNRHTYYGDSSKPSSSQWFKVLNRLSSLNPLEQRQRTKTYSVDDDDHSSVINRDTFELLRSVETARYQQQQQQQATVVGHHGRYDLDNYHEEENHHRVIIEDETEKLPSAYELENDHINPLSEDSGLQEESHYFTHPFFSPYDTKLPQHPLPIQSSSTQRGRHQDVLIREDTTTSANYLVIKDKWDRTLDKIKFIANLQSSSNHHHLSFSYLNSGPSHTLATYYPPAFDPIFAAFAKDEYGRNLVTVTDLEYLHSNSQWIFRVELQYGDIKWVIRRGISDFMALHIKLKVKSNLYDYVPDPPTFPNQLSNLLDSAKSTIGIYTFSNHDNNVCERTSSLPPHYPNNSHHHKTTIANNKAAFHRRMALTQYLRSLLLRAHVTVSYDICEFLELSAISMVQDMGWKGKEGYMRNRINYVSPRCCQIWKSHRWSTEWIILRDSYIAFCKDTASTSPTDVLLFDKGFKIDIQEPRVYLGSYHISISNESRKIEIKGTKREVDQWLESIEKVEKESPWVRNHRFNSFAPVRKHAKVKWFIDAENHFNAVAEAILSAKLEIYIADWWLTPELYLRRPPEENEDFRLDRLLQRKAVEGVKIYIIVYKEMSVALTINSAHTKQWLQNLHPNIIVQRHPDHTFSNDNTVLFWSHHEKIVVVDNRLAFIGGLDLCFGRYDTHNHPLSDYPSEGHDHEVFPGQDYSNPRVKDFINVVQQFHKTLVDRHVTPRMPWHDVTLGVVGPIARDIARHFIQRWNFLKSMKSMHRRKLPFLMPKGEHVAARDENNFSGTCRVQLLRSSSKWSSGIDREHSIYNAYMECIAHSQHYIYIENQFFISTTQDDKLLRNKIAQALVERIKRAHEKAEKFRVYVVIPLVPAFEGDLASTDASSARTVMHFQYITISRGSNSIVEKLKQHGIDPDQYISWFSLRNYGKIKTSPNSQRSAENNNNNNSSMSSSKNSIPPSKSSISPLKSESLSSTIHIHHHDTNSFLDDDINDPFKDQPSSIDLSRLHITNTSTLSDSSSISFSPLHIDNNRRGSSQSNNSSSDMTDDNRSHFVTELLYIHDKLMIIDDRIVLMGSANINDRSQLGNRDSEIAMIVEDTEMVPSFMNGKEYKAAKFAHTLRMQLWKEHLGLLNFENWTQLLQTGDEESLVQTLDISSTFLRNNASMDHLKHHQSTYPTLTRSINNAQEIKTIEAQEPVKMLDRVSRTLSFYDAFDIKRQQHPHFIKNRHDAAALDPLSDHTYYKIWLKRATSNTMIYRKLFRCVPDDTIHTYEQHRKFVPNPLKVKAGHIADPNLNEEDISNQLGQVRGHLVLFPKDYLKDENLLAGTIIDTVTPLIIFT